MRWAKPELTEIKMDAEIGSYHVDDADTLNRAAISARSRMPGEERVAALGKEIPTHVVVGPD
jgi:hypothetical protein